MFRYIRDIVTCLLLLLILAGEAALWVENPMHIPTAFLPARAFGLQAFKEVDSSMRPAISPGHYVIVSAWPYWKHDPQAGDVIAFQYPLDPALADVKRVVAAGGSSLAIVDGITYVDGKPDRRSDLQKVVGLDMPAMRIPPGSYFVMGDDRDSSDDSRDYGLIRRDHIIGVVIWPRPSGG